MLWTGNDIIIFALHKWGGRIPFNETFSIENGETMAVFMFLTFFLANVSVVPDITERNGIYVIARIVS